MQHKQREGKCVGGRWILKGTWVVERVLFSEGFDDPIDFLPFAVELEVREEFSQRSQDIL